jgi:UDP-N-acetylmuramoyl-tripeptide--D-alanyl-D-alanine ligase
MSTQFITTATKGNLNNHIGVPLTLLEINHNTEFAIIEMGANHPGEIAELCSIALPNLGIITNIGKAHLEGFGSQENIISTKKALYDSVGELPGVLFVNGDNPLLMNLSEKYTRIIYGSHTTYNYNGAIHTGTDVLDFSFKYQKKEYTVKTRLAGSYNFENAMAAVACGLHFEIHPVNIKTALEKYQPSNNRSQIVQTNLNLLILDAYNANPSSMEAAIRNFRAMHYPQEVLILGDMRELGAFEEEEHLKIISLLKELNVVSAFLIGPVFNRILKSETGFMAFPDVESARDFFKEHPLKDKTILIKGSRGIRLEVLNDTL